MRIGALKPQQLDAAQRSVYDEAVGGQRGHAPVPLTAWIHSPAIARHAQRLGEAIRFETTLAPRTVALAALIVAAHWRAPYVWSTQEAKVRQAGMASTAIDAIAAQQEPVLADDTDRTVHAVMRALLDNRGLDEALYQAAVERFGVQGVVELVAAAGYYTMVCMSLKTFEIDGAAAVQPPR
jgi:4-carboxymuconolactone decarboxylase